MTTEAPGEVVPPPAGVWRWGKHLVALHGRPLPAWCLKCGDEVPANDDKHRHECAVTFRPFTSYTAVGAVISSVAAKDMPLNYALCQHCAADECRRTRGATATIVAGIGLVVAAFYFEEFILIGGGIIFAVGGLVMGMKAVEPLHGSFYDQYALWMTGASSAFLEHLPELPPELVPQEMQERDAVL